MSSYYREHVSFPNVTSGPAPPYPPPAAPVDNAAHAFTHAQNAHDNAPPPPPDDPNAKRCSVKGCAAVLPHGYPHKMCEECRGRHRIYATTKRAKRKMEKALLNNAQTGQPVVWMPDDDASQQAQEDTPQDSEPVAGPSRPYEPPQIPQINDENSQPFEFPESWDPRALDPRLFSQTSELAGALTLPHMHHNGHHNIFIPDNHPLHQPQPSNQQQQHPPPLQPSQHPSQHHQPQPQPRPQPHAQSQSPQITGPPPPPPAPEIHPVLAEVLKAVPNLTLSTRITSGPTVPVGSGGVAPAVDGPLPPRFCSIKGCKTLIPGNSFFKMCEPCRNRYRNYGTTKRAKWRKEKDVAVQELHRLREEENRQRAEQGLPPRSPVDDIWREYAASPPDGTGPGDPETGQPSSSSAGGGAPRPPRMCTVSHCREILPGDYQFLRCERHRIQNRHHSKLKRVRDKEVKAQVYDGWAAAAGVRATSTESAEDEHGRGQGSMSPDAREEEEEDEEQQRQQLPLELDVIEQHLREATLRHDFALAHVVAESGVPDLAGDGQQVPEETPLGEPSHGVPPAARGTRRTNHVCSIKACANLLSPSNPWKMCDLCRSRDRAGRRLKALRDSGLIPPELAEGNLERMKLEVEGKGVRSARGTPNAEGGEKKGKKRKRKSESAAVDTAAATAAAGPQDIEQQPAPSRDDASQGTAGTSAEPALAQASDGSIAPSTLHHPPAQGDGSQPAGISASTTVFSGLPVSDQSSIVFMNPLSPEQAAQIQTRHEKPSSSVGATQPQTQDAVSTDAPLDSNAEQTAQGDATASAPPASASTAAAKKKSKGKSKAKAKAASQPATDTSASAGQPPQGETPSHAAHADGDAPVESTPATAPPQSTDASQAPLQYPPPPNGYPYYMQPPYMPPYPPPPNYGYPYSPPKGSYAPPPPMYQPPYGAYAPPYPYPGQPYGYPGPPYPAPPPPGQSYPPPPQPQGSPQTGHAYPPPLQPYPYPHAYPPPPTYQSPPPPPQPPPAQQEEQPPQTQTSSQPQSSLQTHPPQAQQQQPPQGQQQPPQIPYSTLPAQPPDAQRVQSTSTSNPGTSVPPPVDQVGQQPQRFSTFIVRTEETYLNGNGHHHENERDYLAGSCTNGTRPAFSIKRKRGEGEDHAGVEPRSTYSQFKIDLPPVPPSPTQFQFVAEGGRRPAVQGPPPTVAGRQDATAGLPVNKATCSNKHCKRVVPASSSGSLCERCKERLKKKQAKAKHRFKLEPKSLLGRSASVQPNTAGTATPELSIVSA